MNPITLNEHSDRNGNFSDDVIIRQKTGILVDQYELTMAQVYYNKGINKSAGFEVSIRSLPVNWGFFIMAGLNEI